MTFSQLRVVFQIIIKTRLSLLVNAAKYVSKSSYMRLIFCNACTVLISKSNIALLYIDSTSSSDEQAISSDTCKFFAFFGGFLFE